MSCRDGRRVCDVLRVSRPLPGRDPGCGGDDAGTDDDQGDPSFRGLGESGRAFEIVGAASIARELEAKDNAELRDRALTAELTNVGPRVTHCH